LLITRYIILYNFYKYEENNVLQSNLNSFNSTLEFGLCNKQAFVDLWCCKSTRLVNFTLSPHSKSTSLCLIGIKKCFLWNIITFCFHLFFFFFNIYQQHSSKLIQQIEYKMFEHLLTLHRFIFTRTFALEACYIVFILKL
jgi:hypothetical protein